MGELAQAFSDTYYNIDDYCCMRSGKLGDVMLKLVLRSDPTKHIAEVSEPISTVAVAID